jgi:hypothetical protein
VPAGASDFRSGLEGVIRLGGNADTNGAVAGPSWALAPASAGFRRGGWIGYEGKSNCCGSSGGSLLRDMKARIALPRRWSG